MSANYQIPENTSRGEPLIASDDESLSNSSAPSIVSAHGFKVSGVGLLLSENDYAEVFNSLALCALPNTPPWFTGIANMRGTPVPVIDLAMFLAITNRPATIIPKILVIGRREKSLGIIIDGYPVHLSIPESEIVDELPLLPGSLNDYAEAYYEQAGMRWITWNKSKLINAFSSLIITQQKEAMGH